MAGLQGDTAGHFVLKHGMPTYLSSATLASSSSWDRRCWIPAPTGSRSLSDSLNRRKIAGTSD